MKTLSFQPIIRTFLVIMLLTIIFGSQNGTSVQAAPLFSGQDLPEQSISAGSYDTCALHPDGSLICFGDYLGWITVPALPAGLTYTQVSVGDTHACGLRSNGSLVCWGYTGMGDPTNVPALPNGLTYTQASAGKYHTCALRSDGSLVCWGNDLWGQADTPALPGGLTYTQVSAGSFHTCALRSDGSAVCWGSYIEAITIPALPGGLRYTQVSAGYNHSCGLRSDGSLICWGGNVYGETDVPTLPDGLSYTQISAGDTHNCGLRSDGSLACWGDNSYGEMNIPALPGGLTYTQISVGDNHVCALRSDGHLVCWGQNTHGQTNVPVNVYGVDTTSPAVVSSLRADPNPTESASVRFTITFSEFVVGVDASDFTLDAPGLAGAGITSVSGSGQVYTVTVNTGMGDGSLRLDLVNDNSIRDAVNLPLSGSYSAGESYMVTISTATATATETVTSTPTETLTSTLIPTETVTATQTATSTSTETATATITLTAQPTNTPTKTVTRTPTKFPAITMTRTPSTGMLTVYSLPAQDGWVLETSETSKTGGTLNNTATTFKLGDDTARKQYRGILSFNTGAILDNAIITGVTLKVKKQGISGSGNPVNILQGFMADIKNGIFGISALQTTDFQTAGSATYGPFNPVLINNVYSINLTAAKGNINKLAVNNGLTQIRLRFKLDDNNDGIANYLILYSGNAANAADRPQLVITYTLP